MDKEVQQAREIGELTATVKNTNTILERMETKLDNAIDTVSTHSNTISLLAKVSSENSGAIIQIQETIYGRDKQSGIARDVDELKKYKCNQEKYQEENRVATKRLFFSVGEKIAIWIGSIVVAGMITFREYFK
jgi:hypothetical protein